MQSRRCKALGIDARIDFTSGEHAKQYQCQLPCRLHSPRPLATQGYTLAHFVICLQRHLKDACRKLAGSPGDPGEKAYDNNTSGPACTSSAIDTWTCTPLAHT